MTKEIKNLPNYLCFDCANKICKEQNISNDFSKGFTVHMEICPSCKEYKGIATPSDFGLVAGGFD